MRTALTEDVKKKTYEDINFVNNLVNYFANFLKNLYIFCPQNRTYVEDPVEKAIKLFQVLLVLLKLEKIFDKVQPFTLHYVSCEGIETKIHNCFEFCFEFKLVFN